MTHRSTLIAGLLLAPLALASCTSSGQSGGVSERSSLRTAGRDAGSGGVCAYYSGQIGSGRTGTQGQFRRRACFPTRSACESWLYGVQTRYPVVLFRKGCR